MYSKPMFKILNIAFAASAAFLISHVAVANEDITVSESPTRERAVQITVKSAELQGDGVWVEWFVNDENHVEIRRFAQMAYVDGAYTHNIGSFAPGTQIRWGAYNWHEKGPQTHDWFQDWSIYTTDTKPMPVFPSEMNDKGVVALVDDAHGNQWLGNTEGVFVYDITGTKLLATFNHSNWPKLGMFATNNDVRVLTIDVKGRIWVGLEAHKLGGGGAACITVKDNDFAQAEIAFFSKAAGMPSHHVRAITPNKDGGVLIETARGFVTFNL